MLRMCADDHEPIIFQGEMKDCPLCIAINENEELNRIIRESAKVISDLKDKIIEKTHAEGTCTENIELDI